MLVRRLFFTLAPLVLGLLTGAAIAIILVFGPVGFGGTRIGPWQINTLIGSSDADAATRAVVARRGLLALNQSEAIYFSADFDDEGQRLSEDCTYRLSFADPPQAGWWSLTLYAEDEFLAQNGEALHSITADDYLASDIDPVTAILSTRPRMDDALNPDDGLRISSAQAGQFNLTLRLYRPDAAVITAPETANLPLIERLSCGGPA